MALWSVMMSYCYRTLAYGKDLLASQRDIRECQENWWGWRLAPTHLSVSPFPRERGHLCWLRGFLAEGAAWPNVTKHVLSPRVCQKLSGTYFSLKKVVKSLGCVRAPHDWASEGWDLQREQAICVRAITSRRWARKEIRASGELGEGRRAGRWWVAKTVKIINASVAESATRLGALTRGDLLHGLRKTWKICQSKYNENWAGSQSYEYMNANGHICIIFIVSSGKEKWFMVM